MSPFPSEDLFPGEDVFPGAEGVSSSRLPHLRVPFEIRGSAARVVEQDSVDEIAQCVYAVLGTQRGERLEEPDFGVSDPTFRQGGMDLGEARAALGFWEPRADVQITQDIEDLVARVRVEVRA